MAQLPDVVEHFWKIIGPLIRLSRKRTINLGISLPIPRFGQEDVKDLCDAAAVVLKPCGSLLRLNPPVYIIGDIHGDIHDLIRILSEIGDPGKCQILFLGDYIDRGGFSVEVVIFLFTLLCKFPGHVYTLRGNHEFPNVDHCTFLSDELKGLYNDTMLFDVIHSTFTWMPLAALIGTTHLCLHGGIGPHVTSIADIEGIQYPVKDFKDPTTMEVLWSDPSKTVLNYVDSTRGCGVLFGQAAISTFLTENSLRLLIRAHQCVYHGTELFKDAVLTVFSTSFYNAEENQGAYIEITTALEIVTKVLQPMKPVRWRFAQYGQVPPRDSSLKRPVQQPNKLDNSPTGKRIQPPIAEKQNHKLSLALVPAIVKPRLQNLAA
jgi:protein phosphatase